MFQISDSTYILLSFYGVYFIDPKFGHWQGFKKIYILKVKYYMNKILISENALTKWYLLGSIEFLATLKCLIIICCLLPAEFWQKYAEVSELAGYVRTSGFYGTGRCTGTTCQNIRVLSKCSRLHIFSPFSWEKSKT